MGRGAEAVEANLFSIAGDHQRPPADQAGTEQGGKGHVAAGLAEWEREACIGDRRGRIAAVAREPREERMVAQIFPVHHAIGTDAAGVAEPRNADTLPHVQVLNAGTDRIDPANDLMAGNNRNVRVGQFAVDDMQIGAADAACGHLDANLTRPWFAIGEIRPFQRGLELF